MARATRQTPGGGEPTFLELRERLRRWIKFYFAKAEARGVNRQEFADGLGIAPATLSNILNDKELPGFFTFSRLHFRMGVDVRELIREDPPAATESEPATPTKAGLTKKSGQ